jgi:hypothetical protein
MGCCREYDLMGDQHAKEVVIEAAESLVDRFSEGVSRPVPIYWRSILKCLGGVYQILG